MCWPAENHQQNHILVPISDSDYMLVSLQRIDVEPPKAVILKSSFTAENLEAAIQNLSKV